MTKEEQAEVIRLSLLSVGIKATAQQAAPLAAAVRLLVAEELLDAVNQFRAAGELGLKAFAAALQQETVAVTEGAKP